jgi:hypothetical protein
MLETVGPAGTDNLEGSWNEEKPPPPSGNYCYFPMDENWETKLFG